MPTERQLQHFEGRWQLDRQITHNDRSVATFSGEALFAPMGGALSYEENGTLTLPDGQEVRATRRYRWEASLAVFFDDGRAFHVVPPTGGEAVHHCPPDMYRVIYDFSQWPQWQATWDVTGPQKAYRMVSGYRRAS